MKKLGPLPYRVQLVDDANNITLPWFDWLRVLQGQFDTLPTIAGAPTTAPKDVPAGRVAVMYDTVNNKLWVYNGAWKGVVLS